ncbi:MAG: SRPBCC family protein [Actinomycetota bacterium]|nr:SRPBCC family protein [Actinomycetota bacterium]
MELKNEFEVDRPIDEAWTVLTDVERIAPCLPGAQLQEVEGDEYRGIVKVKVGPITAQYKGKAKFVEKDDANHRAVLDADGRDSRGQGNARATIIAQLEEVAAGRTKVTVDTDLHITGKVAQFGRGVIADVSEKLLGQFVDNLETTVLSDGEPETPDATPEGATAETPPPGGETPPPVADDLAAAGTPGEAGSGAESSPGEPSKVRKIASSGSVEPVDLFDASGGAVAKRVVPAAGVLFLIWVLIRVLRRGGS